MFSGHVTRLDVIICILGLTLFYLSWSAIRGTKSYDQPQLNPDFFTAIVKIPTPGPVLPPAPSEPSKFPFKSMFNLPEWYRNGDWGLVQNPQAEFNNTLNRTFYKEEEIAWNNFFFQTTKGLMLERGGLDAKRQSERLGVFENGLNWRTILIEANPRLASQLSKNRSHALKFNLAICNSSRTVHYIYHKTRDEVNGILEFMALGFIKIVFPELLFANGSRDWEKIKQDSRVQEIPCVPLMSILSPLGITRINFFLLNVENGEFSVLRGIDFDKIKFDVIWISVKTNRRMNDLAATEKYIDTILKLLTSKGYVVWNRKLASNIWVTHRDFVPYKNTQINFI